MANARKTALQALVRMEEQDSYSNLVMQKMLSDAQLSEADKSLCTALFYGVLERRITLDHLIARFSSRKLRKLEPPVRGALRLGLYQLIFLDKIPPSAAVNESVKLVQQSGCRSASGFVNGVLRSVQRALPLERLLEPIKEETERRSIRYSCPRWLVELWQSAYPADAEALLASTVTSPAPVIRVNTLRVSPEELRETLEEKGYTVRPVPGLPAALEVENLRGIERMPEYQTGLFTVQDASSQLCVHALLADPGEQVLDICSAPGGKAFTCAQEMKNKGIIDALDLYPQKAELIRRGAERLGLSIIRAGVSDASRYHEDFESYDRVLCDAPCSGLGVIRKKPEIKYRDFSSNADLIALQYRILENASRYVKPGGRLVYSTCTLNPAENERQAERFLREHREFSFGSLPADFPRGGGEAMITLMPQKDGTDGFFIAVLERKQV